MCVTLLPCFEPWRLTHGNPRPSQAPSASRRDRLKVKFCSDPYRGFGRFAQLVSQLSAHSPRYESWDAIVATAEDSCRPMHTVVTALSPPRHLMHTRRVSFETFLHRKRQQAIQFTGIRNGRPGEGGYNVSKVPTLLARLIVHSANFWAATRPFILLHLCNDAANISDYTASNCRMIPDGS
jgi:hypothetical protein